jgi:hypothetical protein
MSTGNDLFRPHPAGTADRPRMQLAGRTDLFPPHNEKAAVGEDVRAVAHARECAKPIAIDRERAGNWNAGAVHTDTEKLPRAANDQIAVRIGIEVGIDAAHEESCHFYRRRTLHLLRQRDSAPASKHQTGRSNGRERFKRSAISGTAAGGM